MKYESIPAKEIDLYIRKRNALIVDLRSKEEYKTKHILGAIHFEYDRLEKEYRRLPIYKTLILYCDRGAASTMAAKFLSDKGYRVKNVIGGFHSYQGIHIASFY